MAAAGGFEEAHSHATGHLLLPEDPELLVSADPIVLVDDELSTGATALNTITELHRIRPRRRYVIAALVDLRTPVDRECVAATAVRLGTTIDVVALSTGAVSWPADFPRAGGRLRALRSRSPYQRRSCGPSCTRCPRRGGARESGRHGFSPADQLAARTAAAAQAALLAPAGPNVLVLGTEELMYAPLLIALELADRIGLDVRFSATTRSPVLALDEPGYPIRNRVVYPAADGSGERYAYNVGTGFDDVVLVLDSDEPALVTALLAVCARLHVVRLPTAAVLPPALRGPAFGSYAPDEVGWLLTDVSQVALEAPVEEREEAVQSGGAHYAESLPIEYQPSEEYRELFAAALHDSADRIAQAVGVVTELVLAERGPAIVLASLARAGTPIGILMRRWAALRHGLDLPHYAVSIVRGRGIDPVALAYLARRHDPAAGASSSTAGRARVPSPAS